MKRPAILNPEFLVYVKNLTRPLNWKTAGNVVKWTAHQLFTLGCFALAIYGTSLFLSFVINGGMGGLIVLAVLLMVYSVWTTKQQNRLIPNM